MWRHIPTFVKVQAVILAVPTLVMACSLEIASIQADHKREAARTSRLASIHADQLIADERAGAELERVHAQAHAAEAALQERTAERDQLKDKVAALEAASVGLGSGPVTSGVAVSTGPNHFPWGWCTWWVASKRYVPWNGNAISWLVGAQAYGYPIGVAPRPGAIMVTAESGYGHVALVESVNSAAGSFTVSEMNYRGWGVVDWRTVAMGSWFIRGFVY